MEETFPHYYEDGYLITNLSTTGWPTIWYAGIYRNTNGFPYQWNASSKRAKPVSGFIMGAFRGNKVGDKKCWYGCHLTYKYSAN